MEKIRVLIVDDEVLFSRSLSMTLEEFGPCEAFVVNDPTQAVETARQVSPDVILLDLVMPGMDGGEVRRRLKEDSDLADIPVILLTASENWSSGMEIQTGGDILLSKPVTMENLMRHLEEKVLRCSRGAAQAHRRYAAVTA